MTPPDANHDDEKKYLLSGENRQTLRFSKNFFYAKLCTIVSAAFVLFGVIFTNTELNGFTSDLGSTNTATSHGHTYVFAHMVNHAKLVDWAIGQGANAIEIDVNFQGETPSQFHHGTPCDCTCYRMVASSQEDHVCNVQGVDGTCTGGTPIDELLEHISETRVAMVYFDSKTDSIEGDKKQAGMNMANKIISKLFDAGFEGAAIINGPKLEDEQYLRGAVDALNGSAYENRVFYTMDMEHGKEKTIEVIEMLRSISPYRAFGTGISACAPGSYHEEISIGAANAELGTVSLKPTVWTIDDPSSMTKYLCSGAGSIMTNRPASAVKVMKEVGRELSKSGDFPPPSSSNQVAHTCENCPSCDCDCDYKGSGLSGGGCKISKTPPGGLACKCGMPFAYTCDGSITTCKDSSSSYCKSPGKNKGTCQQGGGDCDGY